MCSILLFALKSPIVTDECIPIGCAFDIFSYWPRLKYPHLDSLPTQDYI